MPHAQETQGSDQHRLRLHEASRRAFMQDSEPSVWAHQHLALRRSVGRLMPLSPAGNGRAQWLYASLLHHGPAAGAGGTDFDASGSGDRGPADDLHCHPHCVRAPGRGKWQCMPRGKCQSVLKGLTLRELTGVCIVRPLLMLIPFTFDVSCREHKGSASLRGGLQRG